MREPTIPELAERLRRERLKSLEHIAHLSPGDLDTVSRIRGRTLRGMLWMLEEHYGVHKTQIHNNRIDAGERATELNALVGQAQASLERLLSHLIGLSERAADFQPAEGEWSVRQVLEHLLEFELRYQKEFKRLSEEAEVR